MGFRQPREVAAAVRRWHARLYRALRGRAGPRQSSPNWCRSSSITVRARGKSGCGVRRLRPFPRRIARRRRGCSRCCGKIPSSIRFVALILGAAPRLADILAQHPHVIDPLIDPSFFGALAGRGAARGGTCARARRGARLRGCARRASACSARSICF